MKEIFEEVKNKILDIIDFVGNLNLTARIAITTAVVIIILFILFKIWAFQIAIRESIKLKVKAKHEANFAKRQAKLNKRREVHKDAIMLKGKKMKQFIYRVAKTRIIGIKGLAGKGKTLLLSLFTKQLYLRRAANFKKRVREIKYLNPKRYAREIELEKIKLIPVATNTAFKFKDYKFKDAKDALTQEVKVEEEETVAVDEIGSIWPKSKSNEKPTEETKEASGFARFLRHFGNVTFIFTEQDGDNVMIEIRRFGYAVVEALETVFVKTYLLKLLTKVTSFFNIIGPAYLTCPLSLGFKKKLFQGDKIKLAFFNLTPIYFSQPKIYYLRKRALRLYWFKKFAKIRTYLNFEGVKYGLEYRDKDKFGYNSRSAKADYDLKFDKTRKRKKFIKKVGV